MKKLTCAAAMLSLMPMAGFAADVKMSGFIDSIYTLSDGADFQANPPPGTTSERQSRFNTSAELDFEMKAGSKADVRLDVDFGQTANTGNYSVDVEQAYAAFSFSKDLGLRIGVMNNPFGWEKQDAPDMYQISMGLIAEFWDNQTSRTGNNVQGAMVDYNAGNFKIFGGILNDLGYVDEEISMLVGVTASPVRGVDITGGLVTMDDTAATAAGNIINVNATWKKDMLMVGGEVILPSGVVDQGIGATVNYKINREFSVTGRYEMLNYEAAGVDSSSSFTIAGLYELDKNIFVNGEFRSTDDGSFQTAEGDGAVIRVELLGTF